MESFTRPSPFLDHVDLERWAQRYHPDLFCEWEEGASAYMDFWEWLEREYGQEMGEFTRWWRSLFKGGLDKHLPM